MNSSFEDLSRKEKLVHELESITRDKRALNASNSFEAFCEYVIKDEFSGEKIKLGDLHRQWISHIGFCINNGLNSLILAPMSHGKCVSPETEFVEESRGRVFAKQLEPGDKILSWSEDCVWSRVKNIDKSGMKHCLNIKFQSGRSAIVTFDHPFLTTDGWYEAQDLVPNRSHVLAPKGWKRTYDKQRYSNHLLYFLGVIIAKSATESKAMSYEDVSIVEKVFIDCGEKLDKEQYVNSVKYRQEVIKRIIPSLGVDFSSLIDGLMCSSHLHVKYFIAGIWDVAGKFIDRQKKLYISCNSDNMAKDLQLLLQYIGISSFIVRQINTVNKNLSWRVELHNSDKNKFMKIPSKGLSYHRSKKLREDDTSNIILDKVLSITDAGVRSIVSVEIDGTHTHITNGLITHNTQIVSIALPLYLLGKNPSNRIKLVCLSDDAAKERLSAVRSYIENDPDYKDVFPYIQPDERAEWTRHKLNVRRLTRSKDASLDAKGVISSGIGGRCNFLLVDDIFDQRTAIWQPASREQIVTTYHQVWLTRIEPGGISICILTRWHENDLAGVILRDKDKLNRYAIMIQAVTDDFEHIKCKVIIPDKYTKAYEEALPGYVKIG